MGFEAKDAPASAGLAELKSGLDETWRAGEDASSRFDLFRALTDDARAAWLGFVVARTLEASLNMAGERASPFQDHLGGLIGIDMAAWWRPTAANYFDRVSKQVILDALAAVGGTELSSRFASPLKRRHERDEIDARNAHQSGERIVHLEQQEHRARDRGRANDQRDDRNDIDLRIHAVGREQHREPERQHHQ